MRGPVSWRPAIQSIWVSWRFRNTQCHYHTNNRQQTEIEQGRADVDLGSFRLSQAQSDRSKGGHNAPDIVAESRAGSAQ